MSKKTIDFPQKYVHVPYGWYEGQELFGSDGFFHQLRQGLFNGILEGEI